MTARGPVLVGIVSVSTSVHGCRKPVCQRIRAGRFTSANDPSGQAGYGVCGSSG